MLVDERSVDVSELLGKVEKPSDEIELVKQIPERNRYEPPNIWKRSVPGQRWA